MTNKTVHVIGGGTRFHIDSHLYLGSKAAGNTARKIAELCRAHDQTMDVELTLTNMADPQSLIDTNEDLKALVEKLVADKTTKVIFFNAAVLDFDGKLLNEDGTGYCHVGKNEGRLRSTTASGGPLFRHMHLTTSEKIVKLVRHGDKEKDPKVRKDIFLIITEQHTTPL